MKGLYIHYSPFRLEFYRSEDKQPNVHFSSTLTYTSVSGETNPVLFEEERLQLLGAGYREVINPDIITVRLIYFKESGKYYSEGTLEVRRPKTDADYAKSWYDTMNHIRELLDAGKLPGLVEGARYEVMVIGEEHPGGYPAIFRVRS